MLPEVAVVRTTGEIGKQGGREIEPSIHLPVGSVGVLYYGKRATGHDQKVREI